MVSFAMILFMVSKVFCSKSLHFHLTLIALNAVNGAKISDCFPTYRDSDSLIR